MLIALSFVPPLLLALLAFACWPDVKPSTWVWFGVTLGLAVATALQAVMR